MAQLEGPFQFTGNLHNLSAYKMKGSDKIIVRMKGGATKERIHSGPEFVRTRENNSEFSGRSRASFWVRDVFHSIRKIADYPLSGAMTGRMTRIQKLDLESFRGERNLYISRHPGLLEGFPLNKRTSWDSVVEVPLHYQLSKETYSLHLELPKLIPGLNFQPRRDLPLYRISVLLGIVPDIYFSPNGYGPKKGYTPHQKKKWESAWHTTARGSEPQTADLKLDFNPPDADHSLMLAVGLSYGKMLSEKEVEMVKNVGAGKIVALV